MSPPLTRAQLLRKYDVPAPRYTSYPTVPYWSDPPSTEQWIAALKEAAQESKGWAMYVHLPFCESLCTFCGCNTTITKDHGREEPYIKNVLGEWQAYRQRVPELRELPLDQMHLGGGTPTFMSAPNLKELMQGLLGEQRRGAHFEGSVEVDPRHTSFEQLQVLREFGLDRISLGVQDFTTEVQRLVNRVQPLEMTAELVRLAREVGYRSVNFDLIYGLPKQNLITIADLAHKTVALRPDRIAFYSFAMVPWIKPAQRLFRDEDLPMGEQKRELYECAREIFLQAGYLEIGMDHFALPTDGLADAAGKQKLHRNFMGYTEVRTEILLGLGVSAISETPTCFHQNEKVLPVYERLVSEAQIPTLRGHRLSVNDQIRREQILKLMTEWQVLLKDLEQAGDLRQYLAPMISDGLLSIEGLLLKMTPLGRPFLRNACMGLDERLRAKAPDAQVFSQSM